MDLRDTRWRESPEGHSVDLRDTRCTEGKSLSGSEGHSVEGKS